MAQLTSGPELRADYTGSPLSPRGSHGVHVRGGSSRGRGQREYAVLMSRVVRSSGRGPVRRRPPLESSRINNPHRAFSGTHYCSCAAAAREGGKVPQNVMITRRRPPQLAAIKKNAKRKKKEKKKKPWRQQIFGLPWTSPRG